MSIRTYRPILQKVATIFITDVDRQLALPCSAFRKQNKIKTNKKMKQTLRTISLIAALSGLAVASDAQSIVYQNNYNSQTNGTAFNEGGPWNWLDNGMGTHTATYQDIGGGNIVVNHTGAINNTTAVTNNTRFGTKWTLVGVSGNTSLNPADYTISFDVRSVSGNWNPINLQYFVVTGSGNGVGNGVNTSPYAIADGWVHVSKTLDQLTAGWWNGTGWVLTDSTWQIELGGPGWPGTAVEPGVAFNQVWQMDNLQITMVPEPSTFAVLVGGLGLLAGWCRYRRVS
jgi:PEP-CTERM motif